MLGGVLHDQEGRLVVGDVIVPAFADRDPLIQVFAVIERLAQLQQVAFARQLDPELAPHGAAAAVAADHILRRDVGDRAVLVLHPGGDGAFVLREGNQLAAIAHGHARQAFRHGFQQRLKRILRDQLIRFERPRAVVGLRDQRLVFRDRGMLFVEQRRLDQREHDEDIHRAMPRQSGRTDFFRQSPCAGRFPWCGRCTVPSSAEIAALPSARSACSECRASRDRWRGSIRSGRPRR